jgi:hypothetical protein
MGYDYLINIGLKDCPNGIKTYEQFRGWCEELIEDIVKNIPENCIMDDVGVVQHGGSSSLSCIDLDGSQLGDDLEKMSKMKKYKEETFMIYHAYWDLTGLKIYELRNGKFKMLKEYDYENEEIKADEYLSFRPVFNEDTMCSLVKNNITEYFAGTVGDYDCDYEFELKNEIETEREDKKKEVDEHSEEIYEFNEEFELKDETETEQEDKKKEVDEHFEYFNFIEKDSEPVSIQIKRRQKVAGKSRS